MRILAVVAESGNRDRLLLALKDAGFDGVVLAGSVEEAVQFIGTDLAAGTGLDPDLILLDALEDPKAGVEECRQFRAYRRLDSTPLLVLSESQDVAAQEDTLTAGATDIVLWPSTRPALAARVRLALRLKHEIDARHGQEKHLVELSRQLESASRLLQQLSETDPLTGTANRRQLDLVLNREWRRSTRFPTPISVLLVDIDYFAAFNERYGRQAGDDCLVSVAQVLGRCLNRPGDLVGRYGGEEFLVILPNTPVQGAVTIGETLRAAMEELKIAHARTPIGDSVTVSIGIASTLPSVEADHSTLVHASENALRDAKQSGRNRVAVHILD